MLGIDSYKNNRMEKYVKGNVLEISRIELILFKWIMELLNGKVLEFLKFYIVNEIEKILLIFEIYSWIFD